MKLASIQFNVDTFEITYYDMLEPGETQKSTGSLKRSVGGLTCAIDKALLTALEAPIEAIVRSLDVCTVDCAHCALTQAPSTACEFCGKDGCGNGCLT